MTDRISHWVIDGNNTIAAHPVVPAVASAGDADVVVDVVDEAPSLVDDFDDELEG